MAEQKTMERDPVCGMEVDAASARARAEHGGRTYLFCCAGCARKFEAAPQQYLKPRPTPSGAMVTGISPAASLSPPVADYVCPMDPEVRQSEPGACPKCGMALEPMIPDAASVKTEYVCPMHSEIVRPEPGSCPICGMALEESRACENDAALLD